MPLPDPRSPPSKADMLVHGADCVRHPLIGCIISISGGPPEAQARSFLLSRYRQWEQQVACRDTDLDLTLEQYDTKVAELIAWHQAVNEEGEPINKVVFPKPILPKSIR